MGLILYKRGDKAGAREAFDKYLSLVPQAAERRMFDNIATRGLGTSERYLSTPPWRPLVAALVENEAHARVGLRVGGVERHRAPVLSERRLGRCFAAALP